MFLGITFLRQIEQLSKDQKSYRTCFSLAPKKKFQHFSSFSSSKKLGHVFCFCFLLFVALGVAQCDQIRLYLKDIGNIFSCRSSPTIWLLLGLF